MTAILQAGGKVVLNRDGVSYARTPRSTFSSTQTMELAYLPTLRSGRLVPVRPLPVPEVVGLLEPVKPVPAEAGSRGRALLVSI